MVNDFNGDGLTDLMMIEKHPTSGWPKKEIFYFYQSTGTNFTRILSMDYNPGDPLLLDVVDSNGDGKLEFLTHTDYGTDYGWTLTNLDGSSGLYAYGHIPSFGQFYGMDNRMQTRILDFNGDGCSDILTLSPSGYIVYEFKGPNNTLIQTYSGSNMKSMDFLLFGDYNGDGTIDIIKSDGPLAGANWTMLNLTSSGFQAKTLSSFTGFDIYNCNNRIFARDMDGDGKTDVFLVGRGKNNGNSYNRINIALSNGSGFNNITEYISTTTMAWASYDPDDECGKFYHIGDFDGDGRYQLLYKFYSTSNLFSFASGTPSHLVKTVIDGFGAKATLTYLPMSNSNVYTRGIGVSYPVSDFSSTMQLVSLVTNDNGIGGTSSPTYKYEGAKIHLQGKGFLGFAKQTKSDDAAGLLTETLSGYNTTYYYPQINTVTKKVTI